MYTVQYSVYSVVVPHPDKPVESLYLSYMGKVWFVFAPAWDEGGQPWDRSGLFWRLPGMREISHVVGLVCFGACLG